MPKTRKMLSEAASCHYLELDSELEAILTEAELIGLYQPPFNIRSKDDKSSLYIAITKGNRPTILTLRKKNLELESYRLKRVFGPFASSGNVRRILKMARRVFPYCDRPEGGAPCFYYHLDLCPGICAGKIGEKEYLESIRSLNLFLSGKKKRLMGQLKRTVKEKAAEQKFEEAAKIKRQYQALEDMVSSYHFRQADYLPNLTTDYRQEALIDLKRMLIPHISLPKGTALKRIEGYDISNTSGMESAASMVVFTGGVADKANYRHFKIRFLNKPNDPAMIKEALIRRQKHPEWGLPNLILIDGGKGQLRAALSVMDWSVPVVSLVKNPDRLLIARPDGNGGLSFVSQVITEGSPAANLLQSIRNESHRFAKRYHTLLRSKKLLE